MQITNKPATSFNDALQVRLVSDFKRSQAYYRDVLDCEVNDWGHALRGGMKLILQQAKQASRELLLKAVSQSNQPLIKEFM